MVQDLFEWDDAKARANLAKHGVDFAADAVGTLSSRFADSLNLTEYDHDHSDEGEARWRTTGPRPEGRGLLVICWTRRQRDEGGQTVTRLISARRANDRERDEWRREVDGRRA